jgi:DNA-binding transcriptional MerR regulator
MRLTIFHAGLFNSQEIKSMVELTNTERHRIITALEFTAGSKLDELERNRDSLTTARKKTINKIAKEYQEIANKIRHL